MCSATVIWCVFAATWKKRTAVDAPSAPPPPPAASPKHCSHTHFVACGETRAVDMMNVDFLWSRQKAGGSDGCAPCRGTSGRPSQWSLPRPCITARMEGRPWRAKPHGDRKTASSVSRPAPLSEVARPDVWLVAPPSPSPGDAPSQSMPVLGVQSQ